MITRPLLAAALAVLSMLAACGGGQVEEDSASVHARAASVGGSGVPSDDVGGIGGSGVATDAVGGIGGSGAVPDGVAAGGVATPTIGGIGGTGAIPEDVGGGGVAAPAIGGIGGSGLVDDSIGGIGGSGLTDSATACGLSGVNVTITGIRLNQSATAGASDAGWLELALPAPLRVNLLALSTGAVLPLNLSMLPDGTYSQVRLLLVANDAATPLADSIATAAGVESALTVAGTAQDGLRLSSAITVNGGQVSGSWPASAVCQAIAPGAAVTY